MGNTLLEEEAGEVLDAAVEAGNLLLVLVKILCIDDVHVLQARVFRGERLDLCTQLLVCLLELRALLALFV